MQSLLLRIPLFLGVSLEVYGIVIVFSIPFFFVWRSIFRKYIKSKFLIRFVSWAAAFPTAFIVYGALIVAWFAVVSYYPKREFNRNEWFADKENRYELSHNIIESEILLGKTKVEIIQLLGDENDVENNHWEYYLGFIPSIGGIDPDVLDVYFQDGKVVKVEQHET